jgi:molybdopterin-guanine dinucleotide biosynthesis protein A
MEKYQSLLPSDSGWIREEQPHQGPLIGFSQGLSHITTEWVLLLACDLPHLTTTAIESWVAELDAIPIATMAYLPKHPDKGWEPLCGFYRRSCLPSLLAHISTGGYSFQGWLQQCEVKELIITNPLWLFNCNTPIDLEQVIKLKST